MTAAHKHWEKMQSPKATPRFKLDRMITDLLMEKGISMTWVKGYLSRKFKKTSFGQLDNDQLWMAYEDLAQDELPLK